MRTRELGRTGLRVSELGLGCSRLGGGVFYRDDRAALRLLHAAFDGGITFYDTADTYGYGRSEVFLGRAFRGMRRRIVLASKVGNLPTSLARFGRWLAPIACPFRPGLQRWREP